MDREWLTERLRLLPLYACAFIRADELVFSERVRYVCETDCPMYDHSWSCPPAVGTVAECRERALAFPEGLLIATVAEQEEGVGAASAARASHEAMTRRVLALVRRQAGETLTLSAEACARCAACAWPDAPCRHPERMFPCLESYGILATDLAERHDIDLSPGGAVVWLSLILYR